MSDKPERLGADIIARKLHETHKRHAPVFGYESEASWKELPENERLSLIAIAAFAVMPLIREAEDAVRKEMECGHPTACMKYEEGRTVYKSDVGSTNEKAMIAWCSACDRQAQAVEKARREALEEACRATCEWCRGEDAEVNANPHEIEPQYIPNCGELEGFVHHRSWGGAYSCNADEIRRLME